VRDFLNLLNVTTTDVVEADDAYVVEARSTEPRFQACRLFCPIRKNGKRVREINDTPIHGKPVLIRMQVHRGSCTECGKPALPEALPFLQPGFWMTRRLLDHIAKQAMRRTFAEVAREARVHRTTASNAFNAFVDERINSLRRETPRVLGLDEKMLLKQFRAVLGNVEARTVLNILPDREASLEAYLRDLPNKQRVEVVCTDMFDGYRTMIRDVMPGRAHVTDKFHVVRRANTALDQIRADVARRMTDGRQRAGLRMARKLFWSRWGKSDQKTRDRIEQWCNMAPILADAYWAKERFFDLYQCTSPAEAERYYADWLRTLPPTVEDKFRRLVAVAPRWLPMVYAYFEHPFTTNYVEAVNRILDDLQRDGRGYSFEVMRAKLMLAGKLENKTFRDRHPGAFMGGGANVEPLETYHWGVDLGRLSDVFSAEFYIVRDGRRFDQPKGLSTLDPDFDLAA
jgi:transposase